MTLVLVAAAMLAQGAAPMRVPPDGRAEERPLYRRVQAGEQRSEGLLRRINCPGRGPVTFVVKQKDGVVQYTARQLTSVDFVVYRKDFRGPITCQGFGAG